MIDPPQDFDVHQRGHSESFGFKKGNSFRMKEKNGKSDHCQILKIKLFGSLPRALRANRKYEIMENKTEAYD